METIGDLSIDYEGRKIYLAGRPMKVTSKEFDVMEFFYPSQGNGAYQG